MKKRKNILLKFVLISFVSILPISFVLSSCGNKETVEFNNIKICHNNEYGGINLSLSDQDLDIFTSKFDLGDSINFQILQDNNILHQEIDIPFYNGYYAPSDSILLVSYPKYPICITRCDSEIDVWNEWNLSSNSMLNITLNTRKKYVEIQEYLNFQMVEQQGTLTDEKWANFRMLKSADSSGRLKNDLFYRSSSPSNNKYNRASITSKLMDQNKIDFDINLSESKEELDKTVKSEGFEQMSPYYYNLYNQSTDENPTVLAQHLLPQYYSNLLKEGIKNILEMIIKQGNNHKYLIHCVEGKDRTGILCALLESLAGATYQYMKDDYLTSFINLYNADFSNEKKLYYASKMFFVSKVLAPICFPHNKEPEYFLPEKYEKISDFSVYAKNYLINEIKLTQSQIDSLLKIICK